MPAPRGLKRRASNASASAAPKIKKKHGVQLEVPARNKVRGRLLACGQGDVGQLGMGEDIMETTRFKFVSALGERIVDACAGGMHSVALDADGKVWTFGCNDEGALGRQDEEFSVGSVELPFPAVAISAGDSHTAALLENGDVYLWGSFRDSHGSMGLICAGREGKACRTPVRLALPEQVAAVASGGDHLVVLTVSGAVYTAGCGEQGQLGRLAQRSASRHSRAGLNALLPPQQVILKSAMRRVWAGSHASLALSAGAKKVLAWGLNNYNQLGITRSAKKLPLYTPMEADAFSAVEDVDSWTQISCGQHHSLALDSNGRCYAVGRHDYGRLGLGEGSGDSEAVTPVPRLRDKTCVSIAAATSSSFAVTDTGEVYAWGMGSEGQLGTGSEEDRPEPCLVTVPAAAPHKPVKVSAGGQHTLLLVVNVADGEDEPSPVAPAAAEPEAVPAGKSRAKLRPVEEMEVSSSAPAAVVDGKKPQKLNGEEEPTPMETDETDTAQEKPTDKKELQVKTDIATDKPEQTQRDIATDKPEETQSESKTVPQITDDKAVPQITENDTKPETTENKTEPVITANKTDPETTEKETEPEITKDKTEVAVTENKTEVEVTESKAEHEITENATKSEPEKTVTAAIEEKQDDKPVEPKAESKPTEDETELTTDVEMSETPVNGEGEPATSIVEKKLPVSEVEKKLPASEVDRKLAISEVEKKLPVSEVERKLPVSEVEKKLPVSEETKTIANVL